MTGCGHANKGMPPMPDSTLGDLLHPRHCRASVSQDRSQLALTFSFENRSPLTIVLPVLGAARLQRNIAQCLYLLGIRSVKRPDAEPAASTEDG
jgi:hypothetical protein